MTTSLLAQLAPASLTGIDMLIVAASVAALLAVSYIFGRKESDTADFFLGGRKVPGFVACLSFVATEISAVTIVSVPATAYSENWQYLQFFLGSAAARILVAFLFIPVFYKYNCVSIYEFLRHRFGPETQYAGSIFFLITRLIASGVRLYAACMAIAMIVGWGLPQTLLLFTGVSIAFIAFGGVKAVVWAGAYQAIFFFTAGAAMVIYLASHVNGDFLNAWHIADQSGRLSLFNFNLNFNDPTTFWAGTANAFFIGLAVFGADQELMQRLLTVKTRKTSQKTLLWTIIAALPVLCTYLTIGTLLYVFYYQNPGAPRPEQTKEIFSGFIAHAIPVGLKGFMLAAIILASIDSPLSSLSSSFLADIYKPLIQKNASERHYLIVSRIGVVAFGLLLSMIALACQPIKNILWFAFQIFSVTGGASLGVFLFGLLTRNRATWQNVVAMIFSSLAMTTLLLLSNYGKLPLAWSWLIVLGTASTFALAWLLSVVTQRYGRQ